MTERTRFSLLFGFLGILFFVPLLGQVHLFDWDEINFAEMAREMIVTNDFLDLTINYQPFWQKPPLFIWMQALSMQLFGQGEFAARFPNAVCGVLTLVLLYNMGRDLYGHRFGLLWALTYLGSILPFLYFKSGIIDPWFNLFIFVGLYLFIRFYWYWSGLLEKRSRPFSKWRLLVGAGLLVGMGILTKGPVAYLIPVLCMGVYWVYYRFRFYVHPLHFLVFTLATTLVTLSWYGVQTAVNGPEFVWKFTLYQIELLSTHSAGHAGFPGYHFIVLLFGVFPASVFALLSFFRQGKSGAPHLRDLGLWMKILFWVVVILFSLVQSKIVHYSSLCYFPISFLAARTLNQWLEGDIRIPGWTWGLLGGIAVFFILLTLALPLVGNHPEWIRPLFSRDPFALGNLEAQVHWGGADLIPGLFLLFSMILTFYFRHRGRKYPTLFSLFGGTALFVSLGLIFFINHIEAYSQRAAIEFFESKQDEKAYFLTYGYKSFAHYFYGKVQPPDNGAMPGSDTLLDGPTDRPVYISAKVHRADVLRQNPALKELYGKNGFVFFEKPSFEETD